MKLHRYSQASSLPSGSSQRSKPGRSSSQMPFLFGGFVCFLFLGYYAFSVQSMTSVPLSARLEPAPLAVSAQPRVKADSASLLDAGHASPAAFAPSPVAAETESAPAAAAPPPAPAVAAALEVESGLPIRFVVVGDWGSETSGKRAVAKQLAAQMRKWHTASAEEVEQAGDVRGSLSIESLTAAPSGLAHAFAHPARHFVLSVGDQFYTDGVQSTDDPRFHEEFEQGYDKNALPYQWNLLGGNHDCRGNIQAQVDYSKQSSRWVYAAHYYSVDRPFAAVSSTGQHQRQQQQHPLVARFIFLDTCSIACEQPEESWNQDEVEECGRQQVQGLSRTQQLDWLKQQLEDAQSDSRVRWVIISGHHPLYSQGPHGNSPALIRLLQPLMLSHSKVAAYLCGHDHTLQHITIAPVPTSSTKSGTASGGGGSLLQQDGAESFDADRRAGSQTPLDRMRDRVHKRRHTGSGSGSSAVEVGAESQAQPRVLHHFVSGGGGHNLHHVTNIVASSSEERPRHQEPYTPGSSSGSGGGSDHRVVLQGGDGQSVTVSTRFGHGTHGFLAVSLDLDWMRVEAIDRDGQSLYSQKIRRPA